MTAVIMNDGYKLTDISVTAAGKRGNGLPISCQVSDDKVLIHGGIPVWALYPDH